MTQLTLNNSVVVPITSYNRYTDIRGGQVNSNANVELAGTDFYNDIIGLSNETITSLKIDVNGNTVYDIRYQNGKITNISEHLSGDVMSLNMTITFTYESEESNDII